MLKKIREKRDQLNKSERKVADTILLNPSVVTQLSIAALAKSAGVSEPTVNRFCRSFLSKGFPDFKIQLAKSLVSGSLFVTRSVEKNDSAEQYTDKIFTSTIATLDAARKQVDVEAIATVVDHLVQAKQIAFFGLGASGSVARDAQHKFFRFNLPVVAYDDVLMQRMVAAASHTGDVIVIISYTGRTKDLVEIAQLANSTGATVVGITLENSPLAKVCPVVLSVPHVENTDIYMPMISRLTQLTLLDVLATGVTLKRGEGFHQHLDKIKQSLQSTRYAIEEK
ncbi:MAG: DNA-binding transcriptional regulator HexR [Osedax symbiont Rs1]|nr:MAG: DNA-binding transcriptional regulator HexR [Osedax symbiont Rs1]